MLILALCLGWTAYLANGHLRGQASLVDGLEDVCLELRFMVIGARPAPDNVAIVALDDEVFRSEGRYPLPREKLAALVEALNGAGARAVVLDLLLLEPEAPADDERLAAALAKGPAVIAAAATFPSDRRLADAPALLPDIPVADRILWPDARFRQASDVGLVNVSSAAGGMAQHLPLAIQLGRSIHPSLVLQAAALALGSAAELEDGSVRLGARLVPLDLGLNLPLRFYGPQKAFRTLTLAQALDPGMADAVRGRIVLVGVTATGVGDTFPTPYDPVLPGVELLATGIANLTDGDALVRNQAIRRLDVIAALAGTLLVVPLVLRARKGAHLALILGLVLAPPAMATAAFAEGYWFSMGLPLAALLPAVMLALVARTLCQHVSELRLIEEQRLLRSLQPAALVDRLWTAPDYLAEPVHQPAAILFVDLSGFTAVSERVGPQATRALLKGFHEIIDSEVSTADGVILSYLGDGGMILFGVPDPRPDDADRAVQAAAALIPRAADWIAGLPAEQRPQGCRIGAHYGDVVLARLGGQGHQHVTAAGDSVNVASRLLETAKARGLPVAFSCALLDQTSPRVLAGILPQLTEPEFAAIRGRAEGLDVRFWVPPAGAHPAVQGNLQPRLPEGE